jgi:hypothetical protein
VKIQLCQSLSYLSNYKVEILLSTQKGSCLAPLDISLAIIVANRLNLSIYEPGRPETRNFFSAVASFRMVLNPIRIVSGMVEHDVNNAEQTEILF